MNEHNRNRLLIHRTNYSSGYQWGEGRGEGQDRGRVQTSLYKINKLQGYIVQHKELQPTFYNNFKLRIISFTPETYNFVNNFYTSIFKILYFILEFFGEGNGNPLQYSCLENLIDRGAWWAAVHGVAKSQARLRD